MKAPVLALIASLSLAGFAAPTVSANAAQVNCGSNFAVAYIPCKETPHLVKDIPVGKVCFYIDTDYSDRHFCESGSRTVNVIDAKWKRGIESIQIAANAEVRVCSEPNLKGTCQLYGDNVRELSPEILNNMQSYRTRQIRW